MEGDLVITREAPMGEICMLPDLQCCLGQRMVLLRPDPSKIDGKFLLYAFQSRYVQGQIAKSEGTGTTVSNLRIPHLCEIEIPTPTLDIQRRVAEIIGSYDDLIENNRRRFQLLEQSARLLFKEWFVHLRFPGHEHVKVIDGVPEGWERRPLSACSKFLSGGTPSKKREEFWAGDIPWVSSGELTQMRIHRTKLNLTEEGVSTGSRLVPAETILAVVRGMSLAKEFRLGITARPVSFNQDIKAIAALPEVDPLSLYHALDAQRDTIRDKAGDASHGTKKLDTPVLSEVPILLPSPAIQTLFREYVAPLHTQWDVLDQQSVQLERGRDLLLPRLMNGEVAV